MNKINLLEETLEVLGLVGKTEEDIRWVGVATGLRKSFWKDVKPLFNIEYDSGWGGVEINPELVIVGDDWWLERGEYDGSEWWEYKKLPVESYNSEPLIQLDIKEEDPRENNFKLNIKEEDPKDDDF